MIHTLLLMLTLVGAFRVTTVKPGEPTKRPLVLRLVMFLLGGPFFF